LDHVCWTKTSKETEWAKESQTVIEYGKGKYGNQKGCMYFRVAHIVLISELNGGAELQRKYLNENSPDACSKVFSVDQGS
jgi:hypothetical protein